MEQQLYTIIYQPVGGDIQAFNTVGVDMDDDTARVLAVADYKSAFDIKDTEDEELSDDYWNEELGEVWWQIVAVDGFEITIAEKQV